MKTIDLLVMKNEKLVTNISRAYQNATVKSLRTRYVTFTSYDENNEYTGLSIKLRNIDHKHGIVHAEICKEGCYSTHFWMDADDDPIIVFNNEPDVEHHIFGKVIDYEINQKITQGGLYLFHKGLTHERFLAVVQSVGPSIITLNEIGAMRFKKSSPTPYRLYQKGYLFSILTSDADAVEKYKNYVVTEVCDVADMFTDTYEDDVEEDDKNESKNQEKS